MANVELKNVEKKYAADVTAVSDFNLLIEDKEFIILVGPSGCGKTTTLRMIAGLEEITDGGIYIDGRLVNNVPPKDRDIAMVFQNYALYPHMTVFDNMAFGLKLRKIPKQEIKRRVGEAARILDITHLLDRKPKALSGGQRQRVALGRAIVREPKVFLLDEPLSNLDAKLRAQMRTELTKLHLKLETTFIYVTHDQTEAMTMGDRIIVMKDGFVQQVDTPQHLYDCPCNIFVASFIGSPQMNFADAKITKSGSDCFVNFFKDGDVAYSFKLPQKYLGENMNSAIDQEVTFGIRPENIHNEPSYMEELKDYTIDAEVEVTELMGAETYLYIDFLGNKMIARVKPTTEIKPGDKIKLTLDFNKVHIFDKDSEVSLTN